LICKQQKAHARIPNEIYTMPMTGAAAAYNWLSYNLYLIAHNVKLQERLINRLKNPEQFWGAYYETFVAAAMIKAGFLVVFKFSKINNLKLGRQWCLSFAVIVARCLLRNLARFFK
jgi:hypothetical protein